MATTTLPTYLKTINNLFMETWDEIQSEVADNITEATPVFAWLKSKGCFKTQEGGKTITRGIEYAIYPETQEIDKGDVLNMGDGETDTEAIWTFRNMSVHIQRTYFADVENRGKYKIADYIKRKLDSARKALSQPSTGYEGKLFNTHVTAETGKSLQGLFDLVPPTATRATGTYGKINRPTNFTQTAGTLVDVADTGNIWWTPRYKQFAANKEINLLADMENMYNLVQNQQENPDGILAPQAMIELYKGFGIDQTQIIGDKKMLDMGFDTCKFRGCDMFYSPLMTGGTAGDMLFLNSNYIEFVYDPMVWFTMTPWQTISRQLEQLAYILCRGNLISDEPRRHGRLYT